MDGPHGEAVPAARAVSATQPLKLADLSRQHVPLMDLLQRAMRSVIERGAFVLGDEVSSFEREFAAYCGCARSVGVDNGTSALELILRALGVGQGDEVIVPAMTFVSTASAVRMTGARPVIVDVDPATWTMDCGQTLARVTPATRAVCPVHLYGFPAPIAPILQASGGKFAVIEDCCQAHGAHVGGRRVGSLGTAGAFSFYPSKNLGCFGDGGMVVTGDTGLADRVAMLRNYGQQKKYEHLFMAYNRRLDAIQAAVLRVKLPHLDAWNCERRNAAALYRAALAGSGIVLPPEPADGGHVYYMFVIRSQRRDALAAHLASRGIETGIHYPRPLHLLPVFNDLGHVPGAFPVAEALAREVLSLPMFPGITESEIDRVAAAVREFHGTAGARAS